jgi:hypothetical protein
VLDLVVEHDLRVLDRCLRHELVDDLLVLSTFAEAENISVNETDIDEELQRLTLGAGEQALNLLRLFDTEDGRNTLRRSLLTRKTLNRLVELASQDTAAVGAATQEEKPSKARRSAPRRTAE